jgi:hypothetical protein
MLRVLRPGGRILWYDFFRNNPTNPNVRGVGAAEIRALFPGRRIELRRVTLAPPLAGWRRSPGGWPGCSSRAGCNSHYLAAIRPGD